MSSIRVTGRRARLRRGSSRSAFGFGTFRLLFAAEGATEKLERTP
jgi:hypothetical protein